jgi:RNA polymerase sigma-70 factor (ECF subfamily)
VGEPGSEPDEDLIRRFRGGDAAAFGALVERHQRRVYFLCLRVLGDAEVAHDVAQDTFMTVLRKLDGFRGDSAFTTWLHRVAVNACYDELRRARRRPMLHVATDEGPEPEPGPPVEDHAEEVGGTLDAAAALAAIPEEFRVALVLADVEDLPYERIAHVLDVPVGTLKSRVHRGRLALAKEMGLEAGEPATQPEASEGRS